MCPGKRGTHPPLPAVELRQWLAEVHRSRSAYLVGANGIDPTWAQLRGQCLYYQPKQCTSFFRENPTKNHHTFVLFDIPQMGDFMTPVRVDEFLRQAHMSRRGWVGAWTSS